MAKTPRKSRSKSYKEYYAGHPTKYPKNRLARLERHLKQHPNDQQAVQAKEHVSVYRRKTPRAECNGWIPYAWLRDEWHPINNVSKGKKQQIARDIKLQNKVNRLRKHGDKHLLALLNPEKQENFAYIEEHHNSKQSTG